MHQSRLKSMYSLGSIIFGMVCFICSVYRISCSDGQRDDFILESEDILSGPIMSVLRKSNPRSVEILAHATSDAISYDLVCASILKEFPTKVLKFEDQKASEIPPRMRLYENLVVLYLYTGYRCPKHEELDAVVKKMRGFHWWFLRIEVLLVMSTIIDCHTIKYLFEEFNEYKLVVNFAITGTKNVVTYHQYDPFENSYKTGNIWNYHEVIQNYRRPDMFGHRIRSSTVNDPPLIYVKKDLKVVGLGHGIMRLFCGVINASYFAIPRPDNEYGLWLNNGTTTGVFHDLISGRVDINPHGLHMFDYGERMDDVEFVDAVYYDEVWALVPKNGNQSISQLKNLLYVLYTMGSLIVIIWCAGYFLRFRGHMNDPLMIFAILMGTGCPRLPPLFSHRIILHSWVMGSVFLSLHFQTALIQSMSFREIPKDIETLEELEASGRNVLMFSGVIDIAYASIEDKGPYINRLRNRTHTGGCRNSCAERLLNSWSTNASCTPGTYQANAYINTMLKNGQQALVITKESFFGSWQTFIVRRGTPWLPNMKALILDLQQSGIISKWLTDHMIIKRETNSTLTFRPLTLDTFYSILFIVNWCHFLSVMTFVFEYVYFYYLKNAIMWLCSVLKRHYSVNVRNTQ